MTQETTTDAPAPTSALTLRPDPMAEAIRTEIASLVDVERGFGIHELTKIEQIAGAGRKLLQATRGHDPKSLRSSLGTSINLGSLGEYDSEGPGYYLASNPPSPVANPQETFGATALRELMSFVKNMGDKSRSRSTIMRELAVARDAGLDDVAAELKQELDDMKTIDERRKGNAPGIVAELTQEPEAAQ